VPPHTRSKETADETRERIARVAEALFRRMGFAKTAVADIAAELGMSPANVYRFFPSKVAIVNAICARALAEVDDEVRKIVARPLPARERIFALFRALLVYHKENFLCERRVHDMVLVAIEENWEAIEAHVKRIEACVRDLIVEGIAEKVFLPHDAAGSAELMIGALVKFCHPILIAEDIDQDLESLQERTVAFLLRSIEVERTPL